MKIVVTLTALLVLASINCQGPTPRGFPKTPKALDLDDHFGTEPVRNMYGPQARQNVGIPDLAREFESVDGPHVWTPIKNLNQEIKPSDHTHGDLTNTAYDASKIIRPLLAHPKAEIDTDFVHEAVVSTPVQTGMHHTTKTIHTANRVTGEISAKEIHEDKPIVEVLKNLREVHTQKKTFLDISNGKVINTQKPTALHGV